MFVFLLMYTRLPRSTRTDTLFPHSTHFLCHLDEEFSRNRIKGGEYAQVYLGSLTQILQTATQFLLQKDQAALQAQLIQAQVVLAEQQAARSEEHTSELQSLMRNSYAVFCLKKNIRMNTVHNQS